jgi:hypothetical protein
MADQLFLSYRLRGFTESNMVRHFEKMLRAFPFSKLAKTGVLLRTNAVSFNEPPLYEQAFETADVDAIVAAVREYQQPDCASTVEAQWDLWQYDGDWKLIPSRASLVLFGPKFETDEDDHVRIDVGLDTLFLPEPELPGSARMTQSNVRSLLHLAHELDNTLAVERRRLWTETGENLAERLGAVLREHMPGPRLV